MIKYCLLLLTAALLFASVGKAQTVASAKLQLLSIKSSTSSGGSAAIVCHGTDTPKATPVPPESCVATNATLKALIAYSYNLDVAPDQADQRVFFGPDWAGTAKFDIEAKAPQRASETELRAMFQALVMDLFKVELHREESQLRPVYVLTVGKGGPKLLPPTNTALGGNSVRSIGLPGQFNYDWHWMTMADFAGVLSRELSTTVIDQTHIRGSYDVKLTVPMPVKGPGRFGVRDIDLAKWFTAIQDQLGLRLEARIMTTTKIIIDSAQQPPQIRDAP